MRCGDGSLYTGIATDVRRRFEEHMRGVRGAKYLRGRAPLALFFQHPAGDRSQASKIEYYVRKLPRTDKEDRENLHARIVQMRALLKSQPS